MVADYPVLPVRRRFWERILRIIDTTGTVAQLRNQLKVIHEATKVTAELPLGHVVAGDFIYGQLAHNLLQKAVISREVFEKIASLADGNDDEQLQSRILALIFLIGKLPTEAVADTGIRAVPLHTLLIPLFSAVREESAVSSNPVAENRAAFQALSIYLNGEDIASTTGISHAQELANPRPVEVRLQQREDLAQHVASIAAISSAAGAELAQLLSTTKEAYDARYRTGFSFSDLTANSVGVALAEFATKSDASALEFQRRVIALSDDAEYMPVVGNNRDGMTEAAFSVQYRDRSSTEFAERLREIQTMIAERPFFANQQ